MKNQRIEITLLMQDFLRKKGYFSIDEIVETLGISRPTFNRAISDYRCYLKEKKKSLELCFNRRKKVYVLRKKRRPKRTPIPISKIGAV